MGWLFSCRLVAGRESQCWSLVHEDATDPQQRTWWVNLDSSCLLFCYLKRHDQFVAFYFYCKIMLISISYNYCSVLTANKCFIETELTS